MHLKFHFHFSEIIQNAMEITCMQTKMKSNIIQSTMVITCTQI